MTKEESYNALFEKVQQAGGYVAIAASERPRVMLTGDGVHHHTLAAAVFIGNDDSSPLKLISNRFTAWDIDDYLNADDIEQLIKKI
jgi:hypothetical protein